MTRLTGTNWVNWGNWVNTVPENNRGTPIVSAA
jgi:hypothetical protein